MGRAARERAASYYEWGRLGERLRGIYETPWPAGRRVRRTARDPRPPSLVHGLGRRLHGPYNLVPLPSIHDPLALFQGARALLPVVAAYFCILWAMAARARFRFGWTSLGFLCYYGALGLLASIFYSPDKVTALYWGSAYIAPLLVAWFITERPEPLPILRTILRLNAAVIVLLMLVILPEAYRFGFGRATRFEIYLMPFGLGEVRANGVGRYAVIVLIIAVVGLVTSPTKKRLLWLPLILPAVFILMQTQSRSSLLGLAVVGMLFVLIRGVNLRFLIAGPAAAYIIWVSGVTWRAKGALSSLVFLTGRETTWQKGLTQIGESPIFGWGFHADRLLLDAEHMHNSYLHAGIQAGVIGALLFTAGVVVLWAFLFRSGIIRRIRTAEGPDHTLLDAVGPHPRLSLGPELFRVDGRVLRRRPAAPRPGRRFHLSVGLRQPRSGTMKILIHTMYYLPDFGSAPVLMDELARYLAAAGHEVEVVTTLPRTRGEEFRGLFYSRRVEGGFVVKRLWTNSARVPARTAPGLEHLHGRGPAQPARRPQRRRPFPEARRPSSSASRPSGQGPPRRPGPRQRPGHPSRTWPSNPGILKNPAAIRFARALEKWVYGLADRIAVISDGFARNLRAKGVPGRQARGPAELGGHGFPDARAQGQPGLAPARPRRQVRRDVFGDDQHQQQPGPGAGPRSGRAPRRGPRDRLRRRRRRIEEGCLTAKAAALGLANVVFLPFQPYPDLPDLLASTDVLLVPLDKDKSHLSVPSKLYTFMAAGRPILGLASPDSEVAALLRENDCGLTAPPDDPARSPRPCGRSRSRRRSGRPSAAVPASYVVRHFAKDNVLRVL